MVAALAAAAIVAICCRHEIESGIREARLSISVEAAHSIASGSRYAAQVSAPRATWRTKFAALTAQRPVVVASRIFRLTEGVSGDDAARARGIAWFIAGRCDQAASTFQSVRDRAARDWNDLAAAQICVAQQQPIADLWLDALVSVDHARALEPLAAASDNRRRILAALGIRTPRPVGERQSWVSATSDLEHLNRDTLEELTRAYPEIARRYAEAVYLPTWAERLRKGETESAQRLYEQIRVIARTLEQLSGEALLADVIRQIDHSGPDPSLVDGLIAYFRGRKAISEHDHGRAEIDLADAEKRLRAAHCPLAAMAAFYRANAIGDQQKTNEAVALLQRIYAGADPRYRALTAHAQYQLGVLIAAQGRWSVALDDAKQSFAAFSAIHERRNAAAAQAVMAEVYDLMGQRELAWQEGVASLRRSCAADDLERARVTLAVLCRTALRGRLLERARSLTAIEQEVAAMAPDRRLDPDMFLRRATAEWRLGTVNAARASFERARASARSFRDVSTRSKLLADVDGAEGALIRERDPRRAIALLDSAIRFQERSTRALLLPELHLQRGRAQLALQQLQLADGDFDAGIRELERQRTYVDDPELRPGIFDDAYELFDEAIALRLRTGAGADEVFGLVERGRARAMLEQLSMQEPDIAPLKPPRLADVQRGLGPGHAVVEYATLPDRVIAFVVKNRGIAMRTFPVTRNTLQAAARDFASAPAVGGRALFDVLFAPLRRELQGVSSLTVVTDDVLQRISFGALSDAATGKFLIENMIVTTSPSAGVFLATRGKAQLLRSRNVRGGKALIFANPAIPRREFGELPSLIMAEHDAAFAARQYPAPRSILIGEMATAERFVALAPRYEVVYFVGHGVFNEREPYASALVCAASSNHQGALRAGEIATMRFGLTRVVILAACSTMSARQAAVEGGSSLSRAFIVAGVPTVIGTLWEIDDAAADAVMRPLHENLARGLRPSIALQAAQQEAIRRGVPPSQWAAFAMMGADGE